MHGFCGFWGVTAVGIFDLDTGLIYTGQFRQLGIQFGGAIAQQCYVGIISFIFFKLLMTLKHFRIG